jgi:hypothetical protein
MIADEILGRLVELDRKVEEHNTAVFLLEMQRTTLRNNLAATGWTPPEVTPCAV